MKIAEPNISILEIEKVNEVLRSKNICHGAVVEEFESKFAKRLGCKYAVAVSSGTAALCLSMKAINVDQGNVITTPFSFFASTSCIYYGGALPKFVDIKESDFNINEDLIEKQIDSKTKAILPVSLYGQYPSVAKLHKIAKKHKLKVVYDNCQAHFAKSGGSFFHGDICCYSFYGTKNMTTGEGGMACTNSEEIYEKLLQLRNHGQTNRYNHEDIAFNYRMTNINAAIGIVQLKKILLANLKRYSNALKYNQYLKDTPVIIPFVHDGHVFNQYTIRSEKRDEIAAKLKSKNIGYGIYYEKIIPKQKAINSNKKYPVAEKIANEVISLPVHPNISQREIVIICDCIKEVFNK